MHSYPTVPHTHLNTARVASPMASKHSIHLLIALSTAHNLRLNLFWHYHSVYSWTVSTRRTSVPKGKTTSRWHLQALLRHRASDKIPLWEPMWWLPLHTGLINSYKPTDSHQRTTIIACAPTSHPRGQHILRSHRIDFLMLWAIDVP